MDILTNNNNKKYDRSGIRSHDHPLTSLAARGLLIALMMEAASTSETSVNFYQTTRRYNPEDSHLHTRRRENLKSHIFSPANFWRRAKY
jgi:hypothetical protein